MHILVVGVVKKTVALSIEEEVYNNCREYCEKQGSIV